jgi:hypothetical protein
MSMTQVVVVYGIVLVALLLALLAYLGRKKVDRRKIVSHFNWQRIASGKKLIVADGEFWLKVSVAGFIALCSGVALLTFILPYGGGWVLVGLCISLLVLALLLPYLFAQ